MFLFVISVLANEDLLKLVLECSALQVLYWKVDHPSDTEEDVTVGLSSKDAAEGQEPTPRIARCWSGNHAPVPLETHPVAEADEVLVKKRALKWVEQQVSALLQGKDLPECAQAREVAEVPYQIPAVPRKGKDCPCVSSPLKSTTTEWSTWGFTGVKNTHVLGVGNCLQIGRCGQDTQSLVSRVRRWHAQIVVRSMPVLRG